MATYTQTQNQLPAAAPVERIQAAAETSVDYKTGDKYKYTAYLPHYTLGRQLPLEEFVHDDVGLRAGKDKKAIRGSGATLHEITPAIGTEVRGGAQLSAYTPAQLDELALLAAERGVVVFRDQDFADIGPERQLKYGQHFSRLHVHQMGGHAKDYPQLLPVYRDFV